MTRASFSIENVKNRELTVGVVGLGFVGLPTAVRFFDAGFNVFGIDVSEDVISSLQEGNNPISDPVFDEKIPPVSESRWNVTSSFSASIPNCDVVIVTVPTPVSPEKHLDDKYLMNAGQSIFENITSGSGTIVVLESTVYPGLTREIWIPLMENSGLELGIDVHLAYCPERYNPGDSQNTIALTSRIVGSMSKEVGEILVKFYSTITEADVRHVGQMEVAESAKLIENVQRDINIALVNELAMILPKLNVDIEEVLEAASTKWNFHRYTPGIGVGGHCIPVDPYFLIDRANENDSDVHLISSARMINNGMPVHVTNQIVRIFHAHGIDSSRSSALILGWSYKPGIGDVRGTPSLDLANNLISMGVGVHVWDPYVAEGDVSADVETIESAEEIVNFDIIIIATAHEEFLGLNWREIGTKMRNKIIFDGRRCLDLEKLTELGWHSYAIGRP